MAGVSHLYSCSFGKFKTVQSRPVQHRLCSTGLCDHATVLCNVHLCTQRAIPDCLQSTEGGVGSYFMALIFSKWYKNTQARSVMRSVRVGIRCVCTGITQILTFITVWCQHKHLHYKKGVIPLVFNVTLNLSFGNCKCLAWSQGELLWTEQETFGKIHHDWSGGGDAVHVLLPHIKAVLHYVFNTSRDSSCLFDHSVHVY